MDRIICSVYRSRRKQDVYIYLDHEEGFTRIPDDLRAELGNLDKAMTIILTPERRLARSNAQAVMAAIREQGYYLQLPPLHPHDEQLC